MRTEENRFKLARTIHNKNGNQSTDKVYKATGISKSNIEDLESNVLAPRNTGYLTIAKLASYYGVSIDYLAGLTNYPTPETNVRAICEHTGLTEQSINLLHHLNKSSIKDDKRTLSFLNMALSDPDIKIREDFQTVTFFSLLDQYVKAFEVSRSYQDSLPIAVSFEDFQVLQELYEFEKKTITIEASEDVNEVISIAELYRPFKMKQIMRWLEHYCEEAEEKK